MIPTLYSALDIVSRELVGVIPTATIDATASGVSMGQVVRVPITGKSVVEDGQSSKDNPNPSDEEIESTDITINKWRRTKMTWTGEEENAIAGVINPVRAQLYAQKMRAVINEMEADGANALIAGALSKGMVQGTAGTTPFDSDLKPLTAMYKKLVDVGAPTEQLEFVMNTEAGMNLRNLTQLQKVNEAGTGDLLRQGVLGNLFKFNLRESAGFSSHKKGTGTGYLVNGIAKKGDHIIAIDTGSGTFKAGDIITFGDDPTQYVVKNDVPSGATSIEIINELVADVADDTAIAIGADYTASAGFARGGLILANRLPLVPAGGDNAIDRTVITDPVSGISFEVAVWGGAYQNTMTFSTCWGWKNIKGEHSVALLG